MTGGTGRSGRRARAVDGGLAVGVLAVVLALARRRGVRLRPGATLGGAAGAIVLEWTLDRRREAVRRWWARPATKAGSLLGVAVAVAAGRRIDEGRTLSAVAGGLATYLGVLVAVEVGNISPAQDG